MNEAQQKVDKKFLFNQNRRLRVQLRQTKQVVQAHKDAINRLTKGQCQQNQIISALISIIMKQNPNKKQLSNISIQLGEMSHKKKLLEKIIAQLEDEQNENYHLLMEDVQKLKKMNEQSEQQLHKFYQKIGEVDYLSGLIIKYKSIVEPKEQGIAFKKQQQQLLQFISMQKDTINRLTEQKNKLLKINVHMKDEVEKKKDDIRNMTLILQSPNAISMLNTSCNPHNNEQNYQPCQNILDQLEEQENQGSSAQCQNSNNQQKQRQIPMNQNQIHRNFENRNYHNQNQTMLNLSYVNNSLLNTTTIRNNLNTTLNFLKMQKQIIKEREEDGLNTSMDGQSDQVDCAELNILFPDKVQQIKKDRHTAKVPYLNMMKIRQMMAKRESKIRKGVEADAKHINPTQKIIKLQSELQISRKELANISLKYRVLEQSYKKIQKSINQLENRNNILMRSNQKYMNGYKNIYKECMQGRRLRNLVQNSFKFKIKDKFCWQKNQDQIFKYDMQQMQSDKSRILMQIQDKILQLDPGSYLLQLQNQVQNEREISINNVMRIQKTIEKVLQKRVNISQQFQDRRYKSCQKPIHVKLYDL